VVLYRGLIVAYFGVMFHIMFLVIFVHRNLFYHNIVVLCF